MLVVAGPSHNCQGDLVWIDPMCPGKARSNLADWKLLGMQLFVEHYIVVDTSGTPGNH